MIGSVFGLLIEVTLGLYLLAFLLRFIFQVVRADFYNEISQLIVKITDPVLRPIRRIVPSVRGIDTSSLVVIYALAIIKLLLLRVVGAAGIAGYGNLFIQALAELSQTVLYIYIFAFLIQVIVSWVNPGAYNPALNLIGQLTEPVLRPIRKRMPATGGIDFSVMVAMVAIMILQIIIVGILRELAMAL